MSSTPENRLPGALRTVAPDGAPPPGDRRRHRRSLPLLAAALVTLVLATLLPFHPASAEDQPVFDTRDGKAPYISVEFPDGAHDTVFQGFVPVTVRTNVYLSSYGSSEFQVRANPYNGWSRFRIAGEAVHTYDLSTWVTGNGETWISWDIRGRGGERYADSRMVKLQKAFDDPIEWEVPGPSWWSSVPQGARIEQKYTCNDYPGYVVVSCGWQGPETEYLYTGTAGQHYATAHMKVRELSTGTERDWRIDRIYQVGDPQAVTVGLSFEQKSWQTGEWIPLPDTNKVVEGTPVRAVATATNITEDEQDVELRFGTVEPDPEGGPQNVEVEIPGAAANFELDGMEMHVERYELSPELLTAWNADGTADVDGRIITATAVTPSFRSGGGATVVPVPRPVVLVHGYKSNAASSWGEYQSIMARSHPNLRAYAVGDGQFPGVMNTGSEEHPFTRTNTIAENAQQEAMYIDGVRKATNAWNVDIVAHSMGGLISRYYVQELMDTDPRGLNVVNRLIQLGTPNRGSQLADVLLAVGAASPRAIPLYPATLQLSTGYIDDLYNKLITDMRGVPISNLIGADIPLLGLPQFTDLWGDGIVPEYSARWDLEDTFRVPGDLHTAMTENLSDFTDYVLPRLRETTPSSGSDTSPARASTGARTAAPEGVTTQTTIVEPGDGCTGCEPDDGPIESADPAVEGVHDITVPAGETVTVPYTIPELWAVGAMTADADLTMEIVHPDGEWSRHSEDAPGDLVTSVYSPYPDAGTWQVKVTNPTDTDRDTSVVLFAAGSPLRVDVETTSLADGAARVEAKVANRTRPVTDATVEATVTDGTPATANRAAATDIELSLVDDGTNGDRTAGDGIYSALTPKLPEGAERTVAVRTTSSAGNRFSVGAVGNPTSDVPEERFELAVEKNGEGNVSVDPQQDDYAKGDAVTLRASAAEGWDFVRWNVDGAPVEQTGDLVLAIDADTRVTADFAQHPEVPRNVAPMLDLAPTATVVEGSELTIDGSFVDPDEDSWTASVDLGDGKGAQPLSLHGKDFTVSASYAQDGPRTITVTVDDGQDTSTAQVAVDVTNAAPTVALTGQATRSVQVGTPVQLTGTYSDPGTADTHSASFSLGSGAGTVQVPATLSKGAATASHTFTAPGTYPVSLTVTDDAGAAATADRIGTSTVTIVVTAAPTQTPKQKLLADFDALVSQHKIKASTAKTLRALLTAAADAHARGNRVGVTMTMLAFDLAIPVAQALREVNTSQAKALQQYGTSARALLR